MNPILHGDSDARARIVLTVTAGPQIGRTFEFADYDTFTIGRSRRATFCLKGDKSVSRMHALFELQPPTCVLKNLSQTGGTEVNGQRVEEATLHSGDLVTLGTRTCLRVDIDLGGQATEPFDAAMRAGTGISPSATHADLAAANFHLPGLRIVRELGRGGMGVVYLAEREKDGRRAAIKTIVPRCAVSEQAVPLFLREASILRMLRHRHIVRFHALREVDRRPCFIMEYVPGSDLESLLRAIGGQMEVGRALSLIDQTLAALGYAHGKGIVHRDVKLRNILLATDRTGREAAKVTDFGLARHFESAGLSGLTRTGQRRGTLAYMAPEQLLDARRADPRSDLYGAAAALYRLLTGQGMWDERPSSDDPLLLVLHQPPVPIQHRRPDLPDGLAFVIHKALARDPRDRFADARQMRRALRHFAP